MNTELSDLVAQLTAKGSIEADDVMALRAQVYGASAVSEAAIDALLTLDSAATTRSPEWISFFGEAMTDFVVRQADPQDYVDEVKAAWVVKVLSDKAHADSGLEAVARILDAATEAPASLETFAFAKAKAALVERGCIAAGDVALLRRLVFAGGGERNIGVSREEADALFDINDACAEGANDPAWADFFAKAIADHLMEASPYQPQSRQSAANDAAWLGERESTASFMRGMARAPDVAGFVREALDPYGEEAREWEGPEAAFEAAEAAARPITDDEARWLIGRLGEGALSSAERALIEFLRAEAPQSSGLLKPLLGGSGREAEGPPPVFGQRRVAPG